MTLYNYYEFFCTELTPQPSVLSRISKSFSTFFRRNRQPPPTTSGTEQQPRHENDGANSPEHNVILRVTPQLVECLQPYSFRLRDHLFAENIISESDYEALDKFSSTAERADYLTRVIAERIGDCDRQFYELINSLELVGSEKWAQDILKILYTARDTLT